MVVKSAKNRRRSVARETEGIGLTKTPLLRLVVNRTGSDEGRRYYGYHGPGYRRDVHRRAPRRRAVA